MLIMQVPAPEPRLKVVAGFGVASLPPPEAGWQPVLESQEDGYAVAVFRR